MIAVDRLHPGVFAASISRWIRRVRPWRQLVCAVVVLTWADVCFPSELDGAVNGGILPAVQQEDSQATIERWVIQLGDEDFRKRREAQYQLEQLQQNAFDALYQARNDGDTERRMAARQLLARIEVDWTESLDSDEVRRLLSGYEQQSVTERRTTVESLSRLAPKDAMDALVRIARFEIHDSLAKLAAVRLMREIDAQSAGDQSSLQSRLQASLGPGKRSAVRWLRLYAAGHDAAAMKKWESFIEDEQFEVASQPTEDHASRAVLRDLLRWYIDSLVAHSESERAQHYAMQLIRFSNESRTAILESLDWLRHRRLWQAMERLVEQNAETVTDEALLLYYVAEMRWQTGDQEGAAAAAEKASHRLGNDGRGHLEIAVHLHERGLQRWAEKEYLAAIEHSTLGSVPDLDARWFLAQVRARQQRPAAAAALFEPLLKAMRENADVERNVRRKREPAKIESEYQYFRGLAAMAEDQTAIAWEHFVRANEADPLDADVLVQMHIVAKQRPEWQELTSKRRQNAYGYYLDQIRFLERRLGEFEESGVRAMVADSLADFHNRYAWLSVNTTDASDRETLQQAVEYSQRATSLAPDVAGYYDTLAHGFAALEQWNDAQHAAQKACDLEPHSQAYRDYLELLRRTVH